MYILQSSSTVLPDWFFYFLFASIIALVIFYFIIKAAVKAGNKENTDQIKLSNRLKILEMKKEGVTELTIQDEMQAATGKNYW